MSLLKEDEIEKLRANAEATRESYSLGGRGPDPWRVVRLTASWAHASWVFTELDGDRLYGLCHFGIHAHLGSISLRELEALGDRIRRDDCFHARGPLSLYAREAKAC